MWLIVGLIVLVFAFVWFNRARHHGGHRGHRGHGGHHGHDRHGRGGGCH
ncbi:MAG: hypothetical protein MUD14_00400 [Hydrococcus sp. Prado102]|jgi:hypothetical protein|nr:hypothetical protein [Hydrococcus sp. Prado102]